MKILTEEQKEKARIRSRKFYKAKREEQLKLMKLNYERNKESRIEYRKQYYKEHKDVCTLQFKQYWKLNKEKLTQKNLQYYKDNIEKYKALRKIYHKQRWNQARTEVLMYYGNGKLECVCCAEREKRFLTIDHINNDGHEHRKKVNSGNLYYWLRNNNYPKGFQTLCFNCNSGRALNKGVCPHQEHQKQNLSGIHIEFHGEV